MGCSPWGHKRLGHDLATKQQQHWLFNKTGFALEVICQVQSLLVGSFWVHLPEALQEAGGLRCNTGPVSSAWVSNGCPPPISCNSCAVHVNYLPVFTRGPYHEGEGEAVLWEGPSSRVENFLFNASVLFVAQIHYKPHFLLFFLDPASAGSNLLVQGFKLILNRLLLGVPSNLTLPSWVS